MGFFDGLMSVLDVVNEGIEATADSLAAIKICEEQALEMNLDELLGKYEGMNVTDTYAYVGYGNAVTKKLAELHFFNLYDYWNIYKGYSSSNSFNKIMEEINRRDVYARIIAYNKYNNCDSIAEMTVVKEGLKKSGDKLILHEFLGFVGGLVDRKSNKLKVVKKRRNIFGFLIVIFIALGALSYFNIINVAISNIYIYIWGICLILFAILWILNLIKSITAKWELDAIKFVAND